MQFCSTCMPVHMHGQLRKLACTHAVGRLMDVHACMCALGRGTHSMHARTLRLLCELACSLCPDCMHVCAQTCMPEQVYSDMRCPACPHMPACRGCCASSPMTTTAPTMASRCSPLRCTATCRASCTTAATSLTHCGTLWSWAA